MHPFLNIFPKASRPAHSSRTSPGTSEDRRVSGGTRSPKGPNPPPSDTYSVPHGLSGGRRLFGACPSNHGPFKAETSAAGEERRIPSSDCLDVADPAPRGAEPNGRAGPSKGGKSYSCFRFIGPINRRFSISHKSHKHAEVSAKKEILEIDEAIKAASEGPDKARSVAHILETLLDEPFFKPVGNVSLSLADLFDMLDNCPINPTDDQAKQHAEKFGSRYLRLFDEHHVNFDSTKEVLCKDIVTYLKSNRSTKSSFEHGLVVKFLDSDRRGSAQKMALETFAKAFPLTLADDKTHVRLLKKLIAILPNLEAHKFIEHSAQRRGLRTLEKALGNVPLNDMAETVIDLMKNLGDLSQKLSRHRINASHFFNPRSFRYARSLELGIFLFDGLYASTFPLLFGIAGVGAAFPYTAIPLAATAILVGGAYYAGEHKQPQGTALVLLKHQLAKLRKDWKNVEPALRTDVANAFKELEKSTSELEGTKPSTLRGFFNDPFIDPSAFKLDPNPLAELRRQFDHHIVTPIMSRCKPVATTTRNVQGYATATGSQRALVDLLASYHNEAKRAGVPDAHIPENFLTSFLDKIGHHTADDGASMVHAAFVRLREMPEYLHQGSNRTRLLSQVVEMTKRLATCDEAFLESFIATCSLADQDCHNNARQIFKALNEAVISDKALKGEEGLDDYGNLIALARSFFHEQELKAATREVIPTQKSKKQLQAEGLNGEALQRAQKQNARFPPLIIEAEVGNAVEIALGGQIGIKDPIRGMGFTDVTSKYVTPEKVRTIQNLVENRIRNKKAFVDYLMAWPPLVDRLTSKPELKESIDKELENVSERYSRAEDAYFTARETLQSLKIAAEDVFENPSSDVLHETRERYNALKLATSKNATQALQRLGKLTGDESLSIELDENAVMARRNRLLDVLIEANDALSDLSPEAFRKAHRDLQDTIDKLFNLEEAEFGEVGAEYADGANAVKKQALRRTISDLVDRYSAEGMLPNHDIASTSHTHAPPTTAAHSIGEIEEIS